MGAKMTATAILAIVDNGKIVLITCTSKEVITNFDDWTAIKRNDSGPKKFLEL
jgi:hypothetical protein